MQEARSSMWVRAAVILGGAAVVIALITGAPIWAGPGVEPKSLGSVVLAYGVLPQMCAVLVLLGARRRPSRERVTWRLIAAGLSLYGIACLWLNVDILSRTALSVPYWTDGIWMLSYGCLFAGVALSGFPERTWPPLRTLIDGLLVAFAVMTLTAATVLHGLIAAVGPGFWRPATALAYPIWDLALLGVLAGGFAITSPRRDRWRWALVAGALLLVAADIGYLHYAANGHFSHRAWYRPLYLMSWLMIALAPWVPARRRAGAVTTTHEWHQFAPGAVALIAGALLVVSAYGHRAHTATPLAAAALALVLVRSVLTVKETREHVQAEADARLTAIVASSQDAVISVTLAGQITSWNEAAERIYGYSAAEAVGRSVSMLVPENEENTIDEILTKVKAGERVSTYEAIRRRKDGALIELSTTISPLSDLDGRPIGASAISRDITEHKRAERELQRLAEAAEYGTDAVISIDLDARVCHWNAGAERLYGYSRQEAVGRAVHDLIVPVGEITEEIGRIVAGQPSFQFEARRRRKDGSTLDALIAVVPWREDGELVGITGIAVDISDRKQIEHAREQALRDLEEAQRIARIGSFSRDPDRDAATWSPQLYEILERDPALGAPTINELMQYLPEPEREQVASVLAHHDTPAERDLRVITGTGEERIVRWVVRPDPAHPGRLRGTVQDITEQQLQANAAAHLAAIVASSQDAIISITTAGVVTSWNDAAERIYGYSESEMLNRHISILLPEGESDPTEALMDRISAGDALRFEAMRMRKDGQLIEISTTLSPITDGDGRAVGASAIVRDIRERKQIEQARERALRDLEEAQRVAHIGSFTWDPATDSSTWSEQLFEIFERDPALGSPGAQGVVSYLHEAERDRWLGSVTQREVQIDDDWRITVDSGTEKTVHMTAYPDPTRPGCFLGTCQDVTEQRRAQEELRRQRDFNDATLDVAGAPIVVIDADRRLVRFNRQSELLSGCSEAEVLGRRYEFLVPPEERTRVHANLETAQAGQIVTQEHHWITRSGEQRLIRWSNQVLRDEAGTFTHLIAVGIDITEQRQAELALKAAEERFRRAFDEAPIGMALLSPDGVLREANAAFGMICGRERSKLAGTRLQALLHTADVENLERALATLTGGHQVITELRIAPTVGSALHVTMHGTVLRDHRQFAQSAGSTQLLCQFQDVTERKRFETQLQFMADHDPLTGLWNRRRFETELDRHVESVKRYGPDGALLMLDVDNFKAVNDTLGHNVGDQLIVSLAGALRGRLRDSDVLARLGGDEFAVLLPKADRAAAGQVAAAVVNAVRTNTSLLNSEHKQIACSVGVAMFDTADASTERSMIEADLAMYDVKAAGGNGYAFNSTTEHLISRTKARLTWTARVEHALAEDRFELAAQPILDLRSDEVHQFELLLRMRGDDGELIGPSAFLYIAERFGMIGRIDEWVVERAIELIARHPELQLEVNISGRSLGDQQLLTHIDRCLHEYRIDPTHLIFEVTETAAVANITYARSFAEHLRDHGCRFALDDFGAGFGSFYYLKHLPFDFVKIDGEFVQHAAAARVDQLVVEAVVGIAQGLGKETIAEFVVDAPTKQMVKDLAVDYAQGYHIGKPVPASELFSYAERL